MRSVPEWQGRHDDESIPPRVKLRIFERCGGRCATCGASIRGKLLPEYDHVVSLVNGGAHAEHNLQLLCVPCHKLKTKSDVAEKAVAYRKRLKAVGIKKRKRSIPGRRFNGDPIPPRWIE